MTTLRTDVWHAVRALRAAPGFSAMALATLLLGIGVNTAMFSVLNTTLLRPLPYPEPERLLRVFRTAPQSQTWPHSAANHLDHRAARSFQSLAAAGWRNFNLAAPGQPAERLSGMVASASFFPTLGVAPALGRVFSDREDVPGQDDVIVLSDPLWRSRFGADPGIVGRRLRIDGRELEVIGVMPPGFEHPLLWGRVDAWRPLAFSDSDRQSRGTNWLQAFGRLRPGVSLAEAQAEMSTLAARLAQDYPLTNAESGLRLVPLGESGMDETGRRVSWLTMGLTVFVLLIACANLANLLLARTTARAREYAVRTALGAPRGRLIAQVMAESLLLSTGGGLLGVLLAVGLNAQLGQLMRVGSQGVPVPVDLRVLGFALLLSLLTGLLFGSLPAWLASRADVQLALRQGGRTATADPAQHRLRNTLVVGQVAMALVLLAGAGLFIRGLSRFMDREPGWQPSGLVSGTLGLPAGKYPGAREQLAFSERLREEAARLPGVERASVSWSLPLRSYSSSRNFVVEGAAPVAPGREPLMYVEGVTPGFFANLEIPLRQGRDFTPDDRAEAPQVVIVNEAMARALWPGQDPLGQRIGSGDPDDRGWRQVVGVVGDVQFPANLATPESAFQAYVPLAQEPRGYVTVALRSKLAPEALAPELRRLVASLDPDQPVNDVGGTADVAASMLANFALAGRVLGAFALLGLLLAGLGLYGVVAVFVAQRTTEFGVRVALGAQVRDLLWLVLGRSLRLTLAGAGLGLLGAFALARGLGAVAPGLGSGDPLALFAAILALALAAALASWLPARRASRVDPMLSLRAD